ncbi:MAG: FAD-linked oxidase C-terminal domain-containing protein [Dehalococcoidales bacterium]
MKTEYGEITGQTIDELVALLGRDNIYTDKGEMEAYSRDESPRAEAYLPQVVVKPRDTASVAKLMAFATEKRIPVTPRGAGTGLNGGCQPLYGGILLSMERMNRILEINRDNFTATVEPGVTLADLTAEVELQELYYPLHPGEMSASIGGNVSTNAGGMNAVKYGVTRQNILGLEVVLPGGEIISTGGEFVKCSTGYDLTQLIIGSEGTLAVVTKIILKLTTKPVKREVLFAPFPDLQSAIDTVPDILRLKITPIGIEFIERSIIEIVEKFLDIEIPYHQYDAFLMVIIEGESEDEVYEYCSSLEEICKQHGAIEAMVPGSERARKRLLDTREKFYSALKKYAPLELIDVVVPRSKIAGFVKKVKEISRQHGIPVIAFGHAGDGNVHLHPVCLDMSQEEWNEKLPDLISDIYRAGVAIGGAISGEHGIGLAKKEYLPLQMNTTLLNLMKNVKLAFDPDNILNPGKIFDI